MQSAQEIIIEKANLLGFPLVGFAKAEPLTDDSEFYKTWVSENKNSTMEWMAKGIEERANPKLILPETESVVVLAMPYNTDFKHLEAPNTKKISRYAWGLDYHYIIGGKVNELIEFMKLIEPDARFYKSIDSGRVLEKAWAVKAGIGFRGRNGLIITENYGSWVFLAVIYTDMVFEYNDNPSSENCGSCSQCITNCPTNAITEDRTIDAKKCLSHWFNEASRKHEIPPEIQNLNTGWGYGCDMCQEICPHNQNVRLTEIQEFSPRINQTELEIDYIENLSREQFNKRFKDSPVKRAKLHGLRRNCGLDNLA
jgi:epoxyqueuosine reductase